MSKKGFKFRIYPDKDQIVLLERTLGCCRFIWNKLLDDSIQKYEYLVLNPDLPKPRLSGYDFSKEVTNIKQSHDWLYEVANVPLQQSALNLGKAFANYFRNKKNNTFKPRVKPKKNKTGTFKEALLNTPGHPQFKKKHNHQSFTLTRAAFKIKNNQFFIAKCDKHLKIKWSRELPSEPSSCTISKTSSGQYFVSFICDYVPKLTYGKGIIGIDLGIKDFAVCSKGESVKNPKHYVKLQKCLRKHQRKLNKCQKGSSRKNKARIKVAKIHQRISNLRNDFLHKLSTRLVSENQAIVIENLKVSNMIRNRKLSKHIADASWSKFRQLLEYKVKDSLWCRLLIADQYYPSTQLCSVCYQKPKQKLALKIREWTCEYCGSTHQRDENASINLEHLATRNSELWINHPGKIILTEAYNR